MAIRAEQEEFLRLIQSGVPMRDAATKIGRSRAIGYAWAQYNPEFAERFAPYRTAQSRSATAELFPAEKPPTTQPVPRSIAIREMAMKRLIEEVRQNGPAAVLASAAILMISDSEPMPEVVNGTPGVIKTPAAKPAKPSTTEVRRAVTEALHAVFDVKHADRPITASCKQITDMLYRHTGKTFGEPTLVSDAVSNFCMRYFAKGKFKDGNKHAYCYLIPVPRKIAPAS